jgi:hypothetical protein
MGDITISLAKRGLYTLSRLAKFSAATVYDTLLPENIVFLANPTELK